MARGKSSNDQETLKMALIGYEAEKQKINEKISQIEALLNGGKASIAAAPEAEKKTGRKRVLSAAARKRIAAAQKKRWAEHRKRLAQSKGE